MLALFHPEIEAVDKLLSSALGACSTTGWRHDRDTLEQNMVSAHDHRALDGPEVVERL